MDKLLCDGCLKAKYPDELVEVKLHDLRRPGSEYDHTGHTCSLKCAIKLIRKHSAMWDN